MTHQYVLPLLSVVALVVWSIVFPMRLVDAISGSFGAIFIPFFIAAAGGVLFIVLSEVLGRCWSLLDGVLFLRNRTEQTVGFSSAVSFFLFGVAGILFCIRADDVAAVPALAVLAPVIASLLVSAVAVLTYLFRVWKGVRFAVRLACCVCLCCVLTNGV